MRKLMRIFLGLGGDVARRTCAQGHTHTGQPAGEAREKHLQRVELGAQRLREADGPKLIGLAIPAKAATHPETEVASIIRR